MRFFQNIYRSTLCGTLSLFVTAAIGSVACNKSEPSSANKGASAAKAPVQGKESENTAREKLKISLDSWTFGDETEKFEKENPGINLFDERRAILPFGLDRPVKLIRYEIGAVRNVENSTDKYDFTFEFVVAMTVQNAKVGNVIRNSAYRVGKLKDGTWAVLDIPK